MKRIPLSIVLLSFVSLLSLSAQEKGAKKDAKEVVLKGEVVDVKCYLSGMMGGKGEDHKQCAIECIKGGLPVGILEDKTDKVYTVVPKKGMEGANEQLLPFVAQKVALTGAFSEKGGTKLFVYTKVEEVK